MLQQVTSKFKLCVVIIGVLFLFTFGDFETSKTASNIVNGVLSIFCLYFKVFQYITVNVIHGKAVRHVDNSCLG